jgi:hypothetical protein
VPHQQSFITSRRIAPSARKRYGSASLSHVALPDITLRKEVEVDGPEIQEHRGIEKKKDEGIARK